MKDLYKIFTTLLLPAALVFSTPQAFAQDGESEPTEETESQSITQGEAALILARRLGFFVGTTRPMDQQNAVKVLMENNIRPFDGWKVNDPLTVGDLARLLVQSMNRENEIPEEDQSNPDTTAYRDLLEREYGLNLEKIVASLRRTGSSKDPKGTGPLDDTASSDPLEGRSGEGDVDELGGGSPVNLNTPLSEEDIQAVLTSTAPAQGGGSSGQVDDDADDTTPSSPTP